MNAFFSILLTIYLSGLCFVAAMYAVYLACRIDRYFLRACDFGCWAVIPRSINFLACSAFP